MKKKSLPVATNKSLVRFSVAPQGRQNKGLPLNLEKKSAQKRHNDCASAEDTFFPDLDEARKEKKMSVSHTLEFTPYVPAVLRKNCHGYVIEYYFRNSSGLPERRTIKMNRIRKRCQNAVEFKQYAQSVICNLNIKLANGWSPVGEVQNTREYVPLPHIIDQYLREKESELSASTMPAYRSFALRLKNWIETKYPQCNCALFTKLMAVQFLDHLWSGKSAMSNVGKKITQEEGHISERAYNNNLKIGRSFFSWCINKCYAKENPFTPIKPKRPRQKTRTLIPESVRLQIDAYWKERNPAMQLMCRLVYTALLRPVEATRVRVNQIRYDRNCIIMPPDQTKNGKERIGRIDNGLKVLLWKYTEGAAPSDYLFSNRAWTYGDKPKNSQMFAKEWMKMRDELKLPAKYQLYSLRDTGISDLMHDGVADIDVMHAAGHSDLSMTTRYADHIDDDLIARINSKSQFSRKAQPTIS